jgi:hypothetical protein
MKRFASTLKCFDCIATRIRLLHPLRRVHSALVKTTSELPADPRTRLLQGAGEAFFFLTFANIGCLLLPRPRRHNDSASLMIGRHGSVNTLGRSSNGLPLWSDAPGVDSSLATQYNNATRLGDTWSKYSLTPHEVDPSPVTIPAGLRRAAKHKYTLVSCCAEHCEQTFLRKDHLTQHIRNKHQDLDSKFRCPVYGCADRSIHLHDLLIHMKQAGHQGDMHFTSIKNAAEKPKCACGDGLIISDRCKACGFQSV